MTRQSVTVQGKMNGGSVIFDQGIVSYCPYGGYHLIQLERMTYRATCVGCLGTIHYPPSLPSMTTGPVGCAGLGDPPWASRETAKAPSEEGSPAFSTRTTATPSLSGWTSPRLAGVLPRIAHS